MSNKGPQFIKKKQKESAHRQISVKYSFYGAKAVHVCTVMYVFLHLWRTSLKSAACEVKVYTCVSGQWSPVVPAGAPISFGTDVLWHRHLAGPHLQALTCPE